jgi:hypothetical protein
VASGTRVEDALIELKANWPVPQKAARRIAGHANAARGEDILWIIGLDEATGVSPVDSTELANWWPQVQSHFDGESPTLTDFIVATSGVYGQPGTGPVEREVPWREGTSIRSARREDLVRLLVPMQSLPDVEVLSASATVARRLPRDPKFYSDEEGVDAAPHLHWRVWVELFISPITDSRVVLPTHRTVVLLHDVGPNGETMLLPDVSFRRPGWHGSGGFRPDTNSIETTSSEALVHLPGRLFVEAQYDEPDRPLGTEDELVASLFLRPTGTDHRLRKQIVLASAIPERDTSVSWKLEKSAPSI